MIRGHTFMTSTKNDQFCDPPPPPSTPHQQKLAIDPLFKDDRIRKHRTNYKTPFRVGAINVWFLK